MKGILVKYFSEPLTQIKIHCGGRAVKEFLADAGFDLGIKGGPSRGSKEVVDTSAVPSVPPEVYTSARVGEFTYTLPMKPSPKGYRVRLYFSESDFGPKPLPKGAKPEPNAPAQSLPDATGKRVFNVEINGNPVLTNFDIYAAAGGRVKAVMKEFAGILPDKDGNIAIHFRKGSAGEPTVNGIEILQAGNHSEYPKDAAAK